MEHFGHFFEFVAAANSVYIVSDEFLKILIGKINSHSKELKNLLIGISKNQENNINQLGSEIEKVDEDPGFTTTVDRLKQEANILTTDITNLENDINESFASTGMVDNFSFWCLFGCLYCILILILNGTDIDLIHYSMNQSFLIFNSLSLLSILWIIRVKKRAFLRNYFSASYNKIIFSFIINATILLIFFRYFEYKNINWGMSDWWRKYLLIISSVILPVSHFIVYYIKSALFSINKSDNLRGRVSEVERKCAAFGQTIVDSFQVIKEVVKVPNNN